MKPRGRRWAQFVDGRVEWAGGQQALADRCGVSRTTVVGWTKGAVPNLDDLVALAEPMESTVAELVFAAATGLDRPPVTGEAPRPRPELLSDDVLIGEVRRRMGRAATAPAVTDPDGIDKSNVVEVDTSECPESKRRPRDRPRLVAPDAVAGDDTPDDEGQ